MWHSWDSCGGEQVQWRVDMTQVPPNIKISWLRALQARSTTSPFYSNNTPFYPCRLYKALRSLSLPPFVIRSTAIGAQSASVSRWPLIALPVRVLLYLLQLPFSTKPVSTCTFNNVEFLWKAIVNGSNLKLFQDRGVHRGHPDWSKGTQQGYGI